MFHLQDEESGRRAGTDSLHCLSDSALILLYSLLNPAGRYHSTQNHLKTPISLRVEAQHLTRSYSIGATFLSPLAVSHFSSHFVQPHWPSYYFSKSTSTLLP